jgi:hypothetical protein
MPVIISARPEFENGVNLTLDCYDYSFPIQETMWGTKATDTFYEAAAVSIPRSEENSGFEVVNYDGKWETREKTIRMIHPSGALTLLEFRLAALGSAQCAILAGFALQGWTRDWSQMTWIVLFQIMFPIVVPAFQEYPHWLHQPG